MTETIEKIDLTLSIVGFISISIYILYILIKGVVELVKAAKNN